MEKASASNNWHYNKKLSARARELRKHATKCERIMWNLLLRSGKLKGYSFTRQRPVLYYIVDFMCKDLMLVIEVDGITHWNDEAEKKDHIRMKTLEQGGFRVIRFSETFILFHLEDVKIDLEKIIDEIESGFSN